MVDYPHVVEQVVKYSDGSETVIKYRGVIVDGVLIPDEVSSTLPPRPSVVEEQPEGEANLPKETTVEEEEE